MNVVCPKCQKVITISPDKLPQDKEMAMIKCPACEQLITFKVPKIQIPGAKPPLKVEEKTEIGDSKITAKKALKAKIIENSTKKEYYLQTGRNIIGRSAGISIDNGDPYISRKHCVIEVVDKNGRFDFVLLGDGSLSANGEPSTNGTFYNLIRITQFDKIYLSHGDKIKIGRTDFLFELE